MVGNSPEPESKPVLRVAIASSVLAFGYAVSLVGGIMTFKVPLLATLALLLAGTQIANWLPKRIDRRFETGESTFLYKFSMFGGSLAICFLMMLFADSDWARWYVHPAGFQPVWFLLVSATFHIDAVRRRLFSARPVYQIDLADYDPRQDRNPYAPPMKTLDRTNNALHRRRVSRRF